MIISYKLGMPNVGSWNGKWTGEDREYWIVRKYSKKEGERIMEGAEKKPLYEGLFERKLVGHTNPQKGWYYNFGDGWGASVTAEIIDSKTANKRRKNTKGFCGYEWMISEIEKYGDILTLQERQKKDKP